MPKHRAGRGARRALPALVLLMLLAGVTAAWLAVRGLVTELAVSSAEDAVITAVNSIVKDVMTDPAYDAGRLVALERSADGGVAAVTTNVAAVNTLAAEVLERAVAQTSENVITVGVPLGSLLGVSLFDGGPSIPVEVLMLSSSVAGFRSELTAAGINQTRHQILLELRVGISLFMPWRTVGTEVDTEILVSETVVVGDVPKSYWEIE